MANAYKEKQKADRLEKLAQAYHGAKGLIVRQLALEAFAKEVSCDRDQASAKLYQGEYKCTN